MIGKLERVPLRDVFPHEAYSLTKWLSENSDVLSDAIGRTIQIRRREHAVGTFNADLVAEDEEGNTIVVENQLEKSNHDHLGKLLTYVSGTDAKCAIWIVSEARPEHVAAITWLNGAGLCAFFLLQIEPVRIGNSDPAPLLTKITSPSEELLVAGQEKKEEAQRHIERKEFWSELLPMSNARTNLFSNVSPASSSYLWAGSGRAGIGYVYRLTKGNIAVELYFADSDAARNSGYLAEFARHKAEIERTFGSGLEWDDMGEAKACRLRYMVDLGGYRTPREKWTEIIQAAVEAMARLENSTRGLLGTIRAPFKAE
jgi:Domain of unknown function (DUF4268)